MNCLFLLNQHCNITFGMKTLLYIMYLIHVLPDFYSTLKVIKHEIWFKEASDRDYHTPRLYHFCKV